MAETKQSDPFTCTYVHKTCIPDQFIYIEIILHAKQNVNYFILFYLFFHKNYLEENRFIKENEIDDFVGLLNK